MTGPGRAGLCLGEWGLGPPPSSQCVRGDFSGADRGVRRGETGVERSEQRGDVIFFAFRSLACAAASRRCPGETDRWTGATRARASWRRCPRQDRARAGPTSAPPPGSPPGRTRSTGPGPTLPPGLEGLADPAVLHGSGLLFYFLLNVSLLHFSASTFTLKYTICLFCFCNEPGPVVWPGTLSFAH